MKKCTICQLPKDIKEFNKNKSRKDGLNTVCRKCSQARSKQYYKENKDKHKKVVRGWNKDHRRELQNYLLEYLKIHSCVDCKESNPVVLEFDHVRGKKIRGICDMVRRGNSLTMIKAELEKCEVRCANCHKIRTAKVQGWYKDIAPKL
jgi:hypothetical protein